MYSRMCLPIVVLLLDVHCSRGVTVLDCPSECNCAGSNLVCNRATIPDTIPNGTEYVTLNNLMLVKVGQFVFDKCQWNKVIWLDISFGKHLHPVWISNFSFTGLQKLDYLGIHSHQNSILFDEQTFTPLDLLSTLNLSESSFPTCNNLLAALNHTAANLTLPNLKNLTLRNAYFIQTSALPTSFFEIIALNRSVKFVDLSDLNVVVNLDSLQPLCQTLEDAYLRGIYVVLATSDKPCTSLRTLDLSRNQFTSRDVSNIIFLNGSFSFYMYVETLILNECLSPDASAAVTSHPTLDLTHGRSFERLKSVSLRCNSLQKLNLTVVLPKIMHETFEELDISSNRMEYMSQSVLRPSKYLKILNLSDNLLHIMQREHVRDFKELLKGSVYLEKLDMSNNHLTDLPNDIFSNNNLLQYVDLSFNRLTTITFSLKGIAHLSFLNLKGNSIKQLGPSIRKSLDLKNTKTQNTWIENNSSTGYIPDKMIYYDVLNHSGLLVDLSQNNFLCICDQNNFKFLEWIRDSKTVFRSNGSVYTCILNKERLDLLTTAISKTETYCKRGKVIMSLSIAGAGIIAVVIIITGSVIVHKKLTKKRKEFENTISQLKHNVFKKKFLVFLSYSSEDDDFVRENIYEQIERGFADIVQSNRDFVCFGDKDFRPGFPLNDEFVRYLEDSAVAFFVVSKAFCKSEWCRKEVREAYDQGKQIIMFMREHVNMNFMPPFFSILFNRYTRAFWVDDEDGGHIEPSWDKLCRSMIELTGKGDRF